MRKYIVLTPEFEYTERINELGGPVYTVRDYVEILAKNKKDAVALGVHYMLTHRYRDGQRYQYVHDQKASWASPYTGVKAWRPGEVPMG